MPEIGDVLIVPFIRIARLIKTQKPPNRKQAEPILHDIFLKWPEYRELLKKIIVSQIPSINIDKFQFAEDERIRKRWEGDTHVLDCPLIIYENGKDSLEIRICISVCTGPMSTKIWARIGKPIIENQRGSVSEREIRKIVSIYRKILRLTIEQIHKSVIKVFSNNKIVLTNIKTEWLEVSAFGLRDFVITNYFNNLWEQNISIQHVLSIKKASDSLSYCYGKISPIDTICNFSDIENKDCIFYTSPVSITIKDGAIERREVLYLDKLIEKERYIIGVGWDDSIDGNLSPKSSLKMAAFIGKEV